MSVYQVFLLPHPPSPLVSGFTLVLFPPVGTSPNVARNAIVNCAELVTYDLIKDALLKANLMTGELEWCWVSSFLPSGSRCGSLVA